MSNPKNQPTFFVGMCTPIPLHHSRTISRNSSVDSSKPWLCTALLRSSKKRLVAWCERAYLTKIDMDQAEFIYSVFFSNLTESSGGTPLVIWHRNPIRPNGSISGSNKDPSKNSKMKLFGWVFSMRSLGLTTDIKSSLLNITLTSPIVASIPPGKNRWRNPHVLLYHGPCWSNLGASSEKMTWLRP